MLTFVDDDIKGEYQSLSELSDKNREELLTEYPLFESDEPNLNLKDREEIYKLKRDWPEGRGIFHNSAKTFHVWVNENEHLRIISRDQSNDVKAVFKRLER